MITGGGRGIGRLLAVRFAALGATVAVVARTLEDVQATARTAQEAGGRAAAFQADVSEPGEIARVVERVADAYGRLDI